MIKKTWKTYAFWILLSELTGALSGFLTRNGTKAYQTTIAQPPLSPPAWLFPVVWTILFILMGISLYLVLTSGAPGDTVTAALAIFALGLAFNFFWSIWFFNFGWYWFAFVWLLLLLVTVVVMTLVFYVTSKWAGLLQIPYILWLLFAAYLNIAVAILN